MASAFEMLKELSARRKVGRFCAIDFDSRFLRIVQAEASGGTARVLKLATVGMPAGIDMTDAAAIGAFLGKTLADMRLRGAAVLMNVPRGQAILKPVVLPPVANAAELANMVQYQAEKELTFRPDEAVIDFTLESHYGAEAGPQDEPQGEHVLVAAVQRPIVDYYLKIAEAAGVRLMRLGLRPYANLRCIDAYARPSGSRTAIVHLTSDEAEIDVSDEGGLSFSRSAVVKVPAADEGAAAQADATQAVVIEVARTLHSYMAVERGLKIDAVVVAGGTGIEEPVVKELGRRLGIRCERFDPSAALGQPGLGAASSAFISALGLAVGQASATVLPFDFLNPKRAPVQRDTGRLVAIGAIAGVVLVLVGAFAMAGMHLMKANSRVADLTAELNKLTADNRRVAALAKRVETVDGWVRLGRDWLDQWAYLSSVFPSCTDAYVTSLKSNPDGSISFTVKAKSNDAINELGKRLAAAGYDFKPGQVTTGSDPYGYGYSTSVKVLVRAEMKVDLASATPAPRPEDDISSEAFGRPGTMRTAAGGGPATGRPSVGPSSPAPSAPQAPSAPAAAPGGDTPYKAWRLQMDALLRERPPSSQGEARKEWQAKLDAHGKLRPPPDPPSSPSSSRGPPPSSSDMGRRRHD